MIRVLIVDDEYIVRLGISSILDWETYGFVVCGTATDGQDALAKIPDLKPDIILADILMQPMNGLELLLECSQKYSQIKFIMLSNSTDFHYVKKAMQLGACDYIFKLEINKDDLLRALKPVPIFSKPAPIKDVLYQKHDLLMALLTGGISSSAYISSLLRQLAIEQFNGKYQLLLMQFLPVSSVDDSLYSLCHAAQAIIEQFTATIPKNICLWWEELLFVVLVRDTYASSIDELFCKKIYTHAKRYINCQVVCGLSNHAFEISDLPDTLYSVKETITQFFYSPSVIFYTEPLVFKNHYGHKQLLSDSQKILSLLQSEESDWFSSAKAIFSDISVNYYLPDIYKSYIRNLLEHISSFFISQGHFQVPQQVCEDIDHNKIIIAQTAAEVEEYALYYLSLLKQQLQSLDLSPEVYSAQKYIKENLHKKITLSEVAQYINVSESYFSHLFKKEAKINFVDYVNTCKIEAAQEMLLHSSMRVNEIASSLGFENPNYFNILFKRLTGKTPGNYRENLVNAGDV